MVGHIVVMVDSIMVEVGSIVVTVSTYKDGVMAMTNMDSMFQDATMFNHPLDNWDVSRVIYMHSMFHDAKVFNQPLDSWDVSSVTDMHLMFCDAKAFNQPHYHPTACSWKVGWQQGRSLQIRRTLQG